MIVRNIDGHRISIDKAKGTAYLDGKKMKMIRDYVREDSCRRVLTGGKFVVKLDRVSKYRRRSESQCVYESENQCLYEGRAWKKWKDHPLCSKHLVPTYAYGKGWSVQQRVELDDSRQVSSYARKRIGRIATLLDSYDIPQCYTRNWGYTKQGKIVVYDYAL